MKKHSLVDGCPIDTTINILKGKCKAAIVLKIHQGHDRFGQLRKLLSISDKLLSKQIAELEEDGILTRSRNNSQPLIVKYKLTTDGHTLVPLIIDLFSWGTAYTQLKSQLQ